MEIRGNNLDIWFFELEMFLGLDGLLEVMQQLVLFEVYRLKEGDKNGVLLSDSFSLVFLVNCEY